MYWHCVWCHHISLNTFSSKEQTKPNNSADNLVEAIIWVLLIRNQNYLSDIRACRNRNRFPNFGFSWNSPEIQNLLVMVRKTMKSSKITDEKTLFETEFHWYIDDFIKSITNYWIYEFLRRCQSHIWQNILNFSHIWWRIIFC